MDQSKNLRVLAVTNLFPSQKFPASGTFVEQQVKGLRQVGINVEVLFVNRAEGGMKEYINLGKGFALDVKSFVLISFTPCMGESWQM